MLHNLTFTVIQFYKNGSESVGFEKKVTVYFKRFKITDFG